MLTSISLGDRYISLAMDISSYYVARRISENFPKISSKSFRVIIPIQIIFRRYYSARSFSFFPTFYKTRQTS